ncbi:MAG: hypothetical protein NC180_06120 [Muribaculaceae bacterium]|nr:peptidyl-prolyl cis-trans isomerase [Roseburia sp.]MCM1430803.1 hypothetical protein [Muribaculaceae bacterium]MCM1492782.1 hypothetical protein [Muribaculaceae bacterium]
MKKRQTALLLAGMLTVSLLTGCGGVNKNATAASMDGAEVSLGIANFYCHYQQAGVEDYYRMYMGDDVWHQDMYGDGTTMQESLKDSVMDSLHDMYTLKAHMADYGVELTDADKAAVTEAASAFMSGNSSDAISEMGATQELVEELLTLYTIQYRMSEAVKAAADITVSDEEANMRGYTQIEIRTDSHTDADGNSVAYTEDEAAALKQTAQDMLTELAAAGATMESVAQAHGYETTAETYETYESAEDAESEEEEEEDPVMAALKGLKEGETSGVIETDSALYIVHVDSDTDAEATQKNRDSIIEQKKNEHYSEVLDSWQEEDGWQVKEKQLAKIQFKNFLTITDPNAPADAQQ